MNPPVTPIAAQPPSTLNKRDLICEHCSVVGDDCDAVSAIRADDQLKEVRSACMYCIAPLPSLWAGQTAKLTVAAESSCEAQHVYS